MNQSRKIIILFDGHCSFCKRVVRWLTMLDWFKRLGFVDYHHRDARASIAPDLSFEELDAAMHIKLPDGSYQSGFKSFRRLSFALPLLWPVLWIAYVPGAVFIGQRMYEWVAARRSCQQRSCEHH